jgi:hypothetical protein
MKHSFFPFLLLFVSLSYGQNKQINHKWSLNIGYGLAGSFFFNGYIENDMPGETDYFKKHFLGTHLSLVIGKKISDRSDLELRYSLERFRSDRIFINDTLNGSILVHYDGRLQHINNFFELAYIRSVNKTKNIFKYGFGIYYLTTQQQEITLYSNAFIYNERDLKNYNLEEGGILIEGAYEYKFQPQVYIGIKSQFYYTVSTGDAESITLLPYIKLLF